jgi:hypothetical protein
LKRSSILLHFQKHSLHKIKARRVSLAVLRVLSARRRSILFAVFLLVILPPEGLRHVSCSVDRRHRYPHFQTPFPTERAEPSKWWEVEFGSASRSHNRHAVGPHRVSESDAHSLSITILCHFSMKLSEESKMARRRRIVSWPVAFSFHDFSGRPVILV